MCFIKLYFSLAFLHKGPHITYTFVFTNYVLNIVQVRVKKRLENLQRLVTNVKNGTADEEVHAPGIL